MRIRYQPHDRFRSETGQMNGLANLHAHFWHSWRILALFLCMFSTALICRSATTPVRDATATTKNDGAHSTSKPSTASSAHSSSATRTGSERTTSSSAATSGAKASASHTVKTAAKRTEVKGAARKNVRERGPVAPTTQRISEIQSALSSQGSYQGDPTGRWDEATVDAMKQFQSTHGLTPSGKLDALSLQKLGLGSDTAGRGAPFVPAVPQVSDVPSPVASSGGSDLDSQNP